LANNTHLLKVSWRLAQRLLGLICCNVPAAAWAVRQLKPCCVGTAISTVTQSLAFALNVTPLLLLLLPLLASAAGSSLSRIAWPSCLWGFTSHQERVRAAAQLDDDAKADGGSRNEAWHQNRHQRGCLWC
jgi:hypothetical protein